MIRRISSIKVKLKEKGMTCVFSKHSRQSCRTKKTKCKERGKRKVKGREQAEQTGKK